MRTIRTLAVALALLAMSAASAAAQDVTGTWVLSVDLGEIGAGEATFVLEQDGSTLSGTYSGAVGEAEVAGTVEGDAVEFWFTGDQVGKVTYTGTISGTTMEGTCSYGEFADGTFKGEKQG